jgi:hypothetical protein
MAKSVIGSMVSIEDIPPLPTGIEVYEGTAELDEKSRELNQVSAHLKDGTDGVGQLALVQSAVSGEENIDPITTKMASVAVEAIRARLGMDVSKPVISTESFAGEIKSRYAVSGISGVVIHILKTLYEVIKSFFLKLKEIIFGSKNVIKNNKERLSAYRKIADQAPEAPLLTSLHAGVIPSNLTGFMTDATKPYLNYLAIIKVLEIQASVTMAAADALSAMSSNSLRYNTAFTKYVESSINPDTSPLKDAGVLIDLVDADIQKLRACKHVIPNEGTRTPASRLFNGNTLVLIESKDAVNPKDVKTVFSKTHFELEHIQNRTLTDLRIANKHELISLLDTLSTFIDATDRLVENTESALKMSSALEKLTKTTELFLQKDGSYGKASKEAARDLQAAVGMFSGWITTLGVNLMKLDIHAINAAFGYVEICLRALDKARD